MDSSDPRGKPNIQQSARIHVLPARGASLQTGTALLQKHAFKTYPGKLWLKVLVRHGPVASIMSDLCGSS